MEILTEHSNEAQENQAARANVPDGLTIEQRLASKSWEVRASAYESLIDGDHKSSLFEFVSDKPHLFLDEVTVRGQEAALKCIQEWSRGTVSFSAVGDQRIICDALAKYGSVTNDRIRDLILAILTLLSERFSISKVIQCVSRLIDEGLSSLKGNVAKDSTKIVAKGAVSRQLIGCLQIVSSFLTTKTNEAVGCCGLVDRVCDLLSLTSSDRPMREACYEFLVATRHHGVKMESLKLAEPQLKELRVRLSDSKPGQGVEESISTVAPSPELRSPGGGSVDCCDKNWIAIVTKAAKWQDRRDAWTSLSTTQSVSEELILVMCQTLKNDLNVPITVEVCNLSVRLASTGGPSMRKILTVLALRLRDKSQPVVRAVTSAITAIAQSNRGLLDARFFDTDLRPLVTSGRKELLQLIQALLPVPRLETAVLDKLVVPCMNEADLSVRDAAVLTAKLILADAASASADVASACCFTIFGGLESLPLARKKAVLDALGLTVQSQSTGPLHVRRSLTSLKPTEQRKAALTITFRDPRPTPSNREEKWNPDAVFSDLHLRKYAVQFKALLEPESSVVADLMASSRHLATASKLWTEYILRDGPHWRETCAVLLKWLVVSVSVVGKLELHARGLMDGIVSNINRGIRQDESFVLVPFLITRMAQDECCRELLDCVIVKSEDVDSLVTCFAQSLKKSKQRRTAEYCVRTLLSLLEKRNFHESKQVAVKSVLSYLAIPGRADSVTASAVRSLMSRDEDLKQIISQQVQTDPVFRSSNLVRSLVAPSRPSTAPVTARVPIAECSITRDFNSAVTLMHAEDLVKAASDLRELVNSPLMGEQAVHVVAALTKSLKPILNSNNSAVRQSVLTLIHEACRTHFLWIKVGKSALLPFVRELLQAVGDKNLRANEPEMWADLNLSVVHAIANSHRPTAYAALLELSRDPSLAGLSTRCLEKINRSLPQYLATESGSHLNGLLRAFQAHIHSIYVERGEAAVLGDDCVMTCLKGICSVAGLVEVGEFVGLHVASPEERLLWKRMLKTYSAAEKRRKSTTE